MAGYDTHQALSLGKLELPVNRKWHIKRKTRSPEKRVSFEIKRLSTRWIQYDSLSLSLWRFSSESIFDISNDIRFEAHAKKMWNMKRFFFGRKWKNDNIWDHKSNKRKKEKEKSGSTSQTLTMRWLGDIKASSELHSCSLLLSTMCLWLLLVQIHCHKVTSSS